MSTSKKGLIIIQLDSVSCDDFNSALDDNYCPFFKYLKKEFKFNTYKYFCGVPAKTLTSNAELFYGKGSLVPSHAWYSNKLKHFVRAQVGRQIKDFENKELVSDGQPLLKNGACVFGLLSGGSKGYLNYSATELDPSELGTFIKNHQIFSIILNRPSFAFSIIILLLTQLVFGNKYYYHVGKFRRKLFETLLNQSYAKIPTNIAEFIIKKYEPEILYVNLDNFGQITHHLGLGKSAQRQALKYSDKMCQGIYKTAKRANRNYELIFLSDHGQTKSRFFDFHYKHSLYDFIKKSIATKDITVEELHGYSDIEKYKNGNYLFLLPSGGIANIYFFNKEELKLTYEDINIKYPGFLNRLLEHEGVGWLLTRDENKNHILIGKRGKVIFSENNINIKGKIGLTKKQFGQVKKTLKEYVHLTDNGSIVLFGSIDSKGVLNSFENMNATHGGFVGEMLWPFVFTNKSKFSLIDNTNNDMKTVYGIIRQEQKSLLTENKSKRFNIV